MLGHRIYGLLRGFIQQRAGVALCCAVLCCVVLCCVVLCCVVLCCVVLCYCVVWLGWVGMHDVHLVVCHPMSGCPAGLGYHAPFTSQWHEHSRQHTKKTAGGGQQTTTTYDYSTNWYESLQDSDRFHHRQHPPNPRVKALQSRTFTAENVKLEAFRLPKALVESLGGGHRVAPSQDQLGAYRRDGDMFYSGNAHSPRVGDLRFYYEVVPAGDATVVAVQRGDTFTPYRTKGKRSIQLLYRGCAALLQLGRTVFKNRLSVLPFETPCLAVSMPTASDFCCPPAITRLSSSVKSSAASVTHQLPSVRQLPCDKHFLWGMAGTCWLGAMPVFCSLCLCMQLMCCPRSGQILLPHFVAM